MTSEMIINTASRCILGDEIRDTVHKEFAEYYTDLERGISHLSFFASWLPTPAHRKRDVARRYSMMDFALKMMDFLFKMMGFALKMMNWQEAQRDLHADHQGAARNF